MTAKRNWRRSIGERGLTPYVAEEAVQQDPLEEDFGAAGGQETVMTGTKRRRSSELKYQTLQNLAR